MLPIFAWKSVLSFGFKILPIVLIVAAFAWAYLVVLPENAKLKKDMETMEQEYTLLNERFAKYEENVGLLTDNIGTQVVIRTQQNEIQGRIRDVEVVAEDKPFVDPGMRSRANILRDYQRTSPVYNNDPAS